MRLCLAGCFDRPGLRDGIDLKERVAACVDSHD